MKKLEYVCRPSKSASVPWVQADQAGVWRLRRPLVLIAFAVLAACGGKSEVSILKDARASIASGKSADAQILLKSLLQSNGQLAEARFLLGQSLALQDDQAGAAIEFQKALDLNYPLAEVLPAMAEAMVGSGQAKRLVDVYGQAQLDEPKAKARLMASLAAAHLLLGQVQAGRAAIDEALKLDSANFMAGMLKARSLAAAGQVDAAMAEVDRQAGLHPARAEIPTLRGDLLWTLRGDLDGAVTQHRKALTLNPRYLPAFTSLVSIDLQRRDFKSLAIDLAAMQKAHPAHVQTRFFEANKALIEGDLRSAREKVQLLLQAAPENPYVLQLAGAIEFDSGVLVAAEARLTKALGIAPVLTTARLLLAETLLRSAQPAKALVVLQPLTSAALPTASALGLAARAHLQAGDAVAAERLYRQASEVDPSDPKLRAALSLVQINHGRAEVGFSQLQRAAANEEANFSDLALYSARLKRNELPSALAAAEALQRKMPGKLLPLMLQAEVLQRQGERSKARDRFELALKADPAHVPALTALASLDIADGRPDVALKRFEDLLARDPENVRALISVAELRLKAGRKPEEVTTLLTEAARKHPTDVALHVALIDLLIAQNKLEAALSVAQGARTALPEAPQILDALAQVQLAAGSTEQAIGSFRKVAAARPLEARPHLRLADAFLATGNLKLAEQSLRKALELEPGDLAAQRGLIQVALRDRRPLDALKVAKAVQQQRPDAAFGYMLEGEIHAARRAWDLSLAAYRAALQRGQTAEIAKWLYLIYLRADRLKEAEAFGGSWLAERSNDAEFLLFFATQALERKQWTLAEERFTALQKLVPSSPTPPNNIAWLLLQQGKPGALPFARRAFELLPGNAAILDTLALALAAERQWKEAVQHQQRAVELSPAVNDYRLRLAKYQLEVGDKAGARDNLTKLSALREAFLGHDEVRKLLQGL